MNPPAYSHSLLVAACSDGYGSLTGPSDVCQEVIARVTLLMREEEDPPEVVDTFESALYNAIFDGELQEQLEEVNPNSAVRVLTGMQPKAVDKSDDGLSAGATAGVVIAALFVAVVPVAAYLFSRNRSEVVKSEVADFEPDERQEAPSHAGSVDTDVYTDAAIASSGGDENLGASEADYGKRSKSIEAMEAGEDIVAEPGMDAHEMDSASSAAGSSGWSSSAGVSSLNTGSMDESMDHVAVAGTTLAAIGVTSALSHKLDDDKKR